MALPAKTTLTAANQPRLLELWQEGTQDDFVYKFSKDAEPTEGMFPTAISAALRDYLGVEADKLSDVLGDFDPQVQNHMVKLAHVAIKVAIELGNPATSSKSGALPPKESKSDSKKENEKLQQPNGPVVTMDVEYGDSDREKLNTSPARQGWGKKIEFLLCCIGYSVGLGNVWRFPYLAYQNGGGAFLIPYLIMLILVGIPTFFFELSLGQFGSLGPITIWKISPFFKGVGFAAIIVSAYIVIYYNVIVSWILFYLFSSMTARLPWDGCGNWWNTPYCLEGAINHTYLNASNISLSDLKSPSEEFFYNYVLQMTPGFETPGTLRWQLFLILTLTWVIVFCALIKGIQSLGKIQYFFTIFPYVLLTVMLVRGVTLPGAAKGITYYIYPNFIQLSDARTWAAAATQIFYSLGVCMGALIGMASFNNFKNNTLRDAMMLPFINCGTSVYAGFVIFSLLGFMADRKGVEVKDVAADGPGLVFVVYPEGLTQLPISPLWAVLFFLMMTSLGFSSQFSQTETIFSSFMDEFPHLLRTGRRPILFRGLCCLFGLLAAIPMVLQGGFYIFKILDDYSGGYPLLLIGFLELVSVSWIYGTDRFSEDISMMIGRQPWLYFKICWRFITPVIVFAIIIFKIVQEGEMSFGTYVYPASAKALAWLIVAFPISVIFLIMIGRWLYEGGWQSLKRAWAPSKDWGPALPEHRTGRYSTPDTLLSKKLASINEADL